MRIISGKLRGLKLNTFDYDNVRPTLDKVRESIFNKIQFGINGASFLDLFSGTGVFAIEAYSRGCAIVYSVDSNLNSIKLINMNIKKAKIDKGVIVRNTDYATALKNISSQGVKFDYIFLDPPFESDLGTQAISMIVDMDILKSDGMIIYEHSIDKPYVTVDSLEVVDERKYGTILVTYLRRVSC